ncbi:MAG: amino acid ABC transporter permease [Lachnospiraceae bacterium]|nr:amino acid ABC transporter permease [Lachnospiraceae bacterium]
MSFNGAVFLSNLIEILSCLGTTFLVMVASLFFSLLLATVTVMGNLGKNKIFRSIARGYITLMRCVPPIVLLFVVYYGAPHLVKGAFGVDINQLDAIYFAIFALSLLHGASISELMRGAYESVEKGQREAAVSIGLSSFQAFYRIIFPQALVTALPTLGNTIVGLLKDGALAYSIGVVDITGQASYLISMNLGGYVLETYLALALIYWILSLVVQKSFGFLETRLKKG